MPTKASEYGHTILMTPKEYEALEKDATRYRWLRDSDHWPAAFASHDAPEPMHGPELDAAIDAAMGKD